MSKTLYSIFTQEEDEGSPSDAWPGQAYGTNSDVPTLKVLDHGPGHVSTALVPTGLELQSNGEGRLTSPALSLPLLRRRHSFCLFFLVRVTAPVAIGRSSTG